MPKHEDFKKEVKKIFNLMMLFFSLFSLTGFMLLYYTVNPDFFNFKEIKDKYASIEEIDKDLIKNGIHVRTGFIDAEGLMTVVNNCTNCHSAKLVTQNRMSKERWNATIRWMQETQNLWDLGTNQEIIVNYLVDNYPVEEKGRRENLMGVEWYELRN